jgi:hypothetical protein
MGIIASGVQTSIGYVAETTYGVTPNFPQLKFLRHNEATFNLERETFESQEKRTDRMMQDQVGGVRKITGKIKTEVTTGSYTDFLEALLGNTFTSGISGSNTDFTQITVNASAKTFTATAGDFIAKGFRLYDVFTFSGDNKRYTILGLTAKIITVAESISVNATYTTFTIAVSGKKLIIGNTVKSFTIEKAYTDIGQYLVHTGCRINSLQIQAPASGLQTLEFDIVGQDQKEMSATSISANVYTASTTNSPLSSSNGAVYSDGVELGTVASLSLSINNEISGKAVMGSNVVPQNVFGKSQKISGSIAILFENKVLYNKFINEESLSLSFNFDAPNGDLLVIKMPRVKFNKADITDGDTDGLVINIDFVALAPTQTIHESSHIIIQQI